MIFKKYYKIEYNGTHEWLNRKESDKKDIEHEENNDNNDTNKENNNSKNNN